jgi:hypothetical protein
MNANITAASLGGTVAAATPPSTAAASPSSPVLPIDLKGGLSLPVEQARKIGEGLSERYAFAEPFPHIVLDNFLPNDIATLLLKEFPVNRLSSDHVFEIGYAGQFKRQILPEECTPEARRLFHFFNSAPMLQFLEGLSSIPSLLPDPYFAGGGYHETTRGGKLGVHADFRIHTQLHLQRRLNLIVYLNPNWEDQWGGKLELWDKAMKNMVAQVAPIFNRCIIFNTDADSFHGHPDPLNTPSDVARRSIALYYYTASKTIYKEVPSHSTVYHARPGDDASVKKEAWKLRLDQHILQWCPPALTRYVFAIKNRLVR